MKPEFLVATMVGLFMLLLLGPLSAGDTNTSIEPFVSQLRALADQIKTLELRVHELEQRCSLQQAKGAGDTSLADSVSGSWRRIKEGLTKDEVKDLLGVPQQQFMLSGKSLWYYDYPTAGAGSVIFDENGRVVGSQAPPRRWW